MFLPVRSKLLDKGDDLFFLFDPLVADFSDGVGVGFVVAQKVCFSEQAVVFHHFPEEFNELFFLTVGERAAFVRVVKASRVGVDDVFEEFKDGFESFRYFSADLAQKEFFCFNSADFEFIVELVKFR